MKTAELLHSRKRIARTTKKTEERITMKNGFYMGYDACGLHPAEVAEQARILLDDGWFSAGYQLVELGHVNPEQRDEIIQTAVRLSRIGFQIGIRTGAEASPEEMQTEVKAFNARMITIEHKGDRKKTEALVSAVPPGIRIGIAVAEEELAWAATLADTVVLNVMKPESDFFEITRNELDSCRDGDTDSTRSAANLRTDCLKPGGRILAGNLVTRFDTYRNEAVFLQMCMLGHPLMLQGDLSRITLELAETLCDERLIHLAGCCAGRVLRYYDPWHVLLGKADGDKYAYALILNRCHGDQPTNLLPADLGWEGRFAVRLWPEDELAGASLETYETHVETSDHPQTPCCRLLRVEKL